MAIGLMNFQPESFAQANPLLAGLQAGQNLYANAIQNYYAAPMARQQLLRSQLQNQILQPQAQYAPQMTQADLALAQAKVPLTQAQTQQILQGQIPLDRAQAADAYSRVPLNQAQASWLNTQNRYYPYLITGKLDPITRLSLASQGILTPGQPLNAQAPGAAGPMPGTVPTSPAANAQATGAAAYPAAATSAAPNYLSPQTPLGLPSYQDMLRQQIVNQMIQLGRNPAMGSTRGGAGGTYTNPFTGGVYSTDTQKNTSADQAAVSAVQRVTPIINDLTNTLPQFQTGLTKAKTLAESLANYGLGTNFQLPSIKAAGEANLNKAAEGLLKAWGLNVTDQSLDMMKSTLKPVFGESPQGYKNRVQSSIPDLYRNEMQAAQRLSGGIPLNGYQSAASPYALPMGSGPSGLSGRVRVISPDGKVGSISASNLNNALKLGYKQVQ